ncbi:hypothetical protein HYU23_01510 [Candidatus Woesearchaeota archaeon]|nr:hypothetical protein [Candidatus Woesearchaeota archaeon]
MKIRFIVVILGIFLMLSFPFYAEAYTQDSSNQEPVNDVSNDFSDNPNFDPVLCKEKGPKEFWVSTREDTVDDIPGDCKCKDKNGNCSLRAAVIEANAYEEGNVKINVPAGVYSLTISGPDEDNSFSGDLDITRPLTIQGAGIGRTVIFGTGPDFGTDPYAVYDYFNGEIMDRIFHIKTHEALFNIVNINGVDIRNGYAYSGGGVFVDQSNLNLNNSRIFFSAASFEGGGIHVLNGKLTLGNSEIRNNVGFWRGGGISCDSPNYAYNSLDILNSSIGLSLDAEVGTGNKAQLGSGVYSENCNINIKESVIRANTGISRYGSETFGGGIFIESGPKINIIKTKIFQNVAKFGGGLFFNYNYPYSVYMENSDIFNNVALMAGGGIYNNNTILTVKSTSIRDNSARPVFEDKKTKEAMGGGIFNNINGVLTLLSSTISGNEAYIFDAPSHGGGIYSLSSKPITMKDVTVSGNTANFGGGIYSISPVINGIQYTGGFIANSVTITENKATKKDNFPETGIGGGIHAQRSELSNTILAGNFDDSGKGPDNFGGTIWSNGYNLIGIDPKLAPLADNGGPTKTHGLKYGSPAKDTGSPESDPSKYACEKTDQRGIARPQGPRCDIGAYEIMVNYNNNVLILG